MFRVALLFAAAVGLLTLDDGTEIATLHYTGTPTLAAPLENVTVYMLGNVTCDYASYPMPSGEGNAVLGFVDNEEGVTCEFPQDWADHAAGLGYKAFVMFTDRVNQEWRKFSCLVFWSRVTNTIPVIEAVTDVVPEFIRVLDDSKHIKLESGWIISAILLQIVFAGFCAMKVYCAFIRLRPRLREKLNPAALFLWLELFAALFGLVLDVDYLGIFAIYPFPVVQTLTTVVLVLCASSTFICSVFLNRVLVEAGYEQARSFHRVLDAVLFAFSIIADLIYLVCVGYSISSANLVVIVYSMGTVFFQSWMGSSFVRAKRKVFSILDQEKSKTEKEGHILRNLYISAILMFFYCLFFFMIGTLTFLGNLFALTCMLFVGMILTLSQLFQVISIPKLDIPQTKTGTKTATTHKK